MEAMALFLQISLKEFMRLYTRRVGQRYSLLESKKSYDCIFLKEKKCRVYGARPTQCRTYPFWPHILRSEASWEETAHTCEGIDSDAPNVSFEAIEEQHLIQLNRNEKI
jgi:uncharacterized protein